MNEQLQVRTIKDAVSAERLAALVNSIAGQLSTLGRSPCVIAEAPDKFNDSFNDDYWYAVQVGQSVWEQSHYFKGMSRTEIKEHSRSVGGIDVDLRGAMGPEVSDPQLAEARRILHHIQKAGWRSLISNALGTYGEILALVFQCDQIWLVQSSSVEEDGHVWICTKSDQFIHFGTTIRLDNEIGRPAPVSFNQVNPDAVAHLSNTARAQFQPAVQNEQAHMALENIVTIAAREASKITSEPLTLVSKGSRLNLIWSGSNELDYRDRGSVIWKSYQEYALKPCARKAYPGTRQRNMHPKQVFALSTLVALLEDADWRGLYGKAFGIELVLNDVLALFVGPSYAVLVRNNSAFLIEDNKLEYIGLCDYPDCYQPDTPP